MDFLTDNLVALTRKQRDVANKILQESESHVDAEIVPSKSGIPTIRLSDPQGTFFVHSMYDPVREAQRFIANISAQKEKNFFVVYGFGLGYHVEALLNLMEENAKVIIVEPHLPLLRMALSARDMQNIIAHPAVVFVVGETAEAAAENVGKSVDFTMITGVEFIAFPALQRLAPDYFAKLTPAIKDDFNLHVVQVATEVVSSRLWLKNALENLPEMLRCPGVAALRNVLAGRPAVIVSAGPSLDRNIDLLQKVKGKAIILCAGTAWKALRAHGIEPDIVGSMDPFKENFPHFSGINSKGAALLADAASAPDVVAHFNGHKLFCYTWGELHRAVGDLTGDKGVLPSGGSVATTLFTFAVFLGAKPIILIGQDLSFEGSRTHAGGTVYENQRLENSGHEPFHAKIPGYYGGQVLTNMQMFNFCKWFEAATADHPDLYVINATQGGARISGTHPMTFQEAIDRYIEGHSFDREELLRVTGQFTPKVSREILQRVQKVSLELQKFKDMAEEAARITKKLAPIAEDIKQAARVRQMVCKLDLLDKKLAKRSIAKAMLDFVLKEQIFSALRGARAKENNEISRLERSHNLYISVALACSELQDTLKKVDAKLARGDGSDDQSC